MTASWSATSSICMPSQMLSPTSISRISPAVITRTTTWGPSWSTLPVSVRFSQRLSRDHLVLGLDEDPGGLGYVADLAGAGHDPLERPLALGHQGEARLSRRPEQPGRLGKGV